MTRKECLDKAAECVLHDRANDYGGPEDNFGRIAKLWSTYTGTVLDGIDVAMMMALLKVARIRNNKSYEDGYIDLAGYAACGAELAGAEKAREDATRRWGEEYRRLRAKAEAQQEFKPGDKVQFCLFPHADVWLDGIVERVEGCHCFIRRSNGVEVSAPKRLFRRPCAEGCEEPEFKPGDRVQCRVTLPSVSDRLWVDGTYARYDRGCAFPHAVYNDAGLEENVKDEDIRPAPKKAEGVEELVVSPFDEARMRESMPGIVPQDGPSDMDEPRHLLLHKPTGEELAEIAQEDEKHG